MENHSQTTMVGGPIKAHEFLRKPDFDRELNMVIRKNGALKYIAKDRVKEETAVSVETEVRKQIARIKEYREKKAAKVPQPALLKTGSTNEEENAHAEQTLQNSMWVAELKSFK